MTSSIQGDGDSGVPVCLTLLSERIECSLPANKKATWHSEFHAAIRPGADLSHVRPTFVAWLLEDLLNLAPSLATWKVLERVAQLFREEAPQSHAWLRAILDAQSAEEQEVSFSGSLAARCAMVAGMSEYAATSPDREVRSNAPVDGAMVIFWAAKAHAEAPAHSAFLCREAWTGADAKLATDNAYTTFAEKLLELVRAA